MTSTIKVNNIQNQCGANIANKCGSTITLGASGDTITLACGASQTGFGRTGTVDWDTTAKTASFTAVSGNGYFVNTTSGAITVTLPAGSAGDIVGISDYASTFQTNNVTITPNGTDKINGVNDNATLSTQGLAVSLVYVDATRGWKSVTGSDNDTTGVVPTFITATGGTITCCGDYKIHTFTGPGTFTVCSVSSTPSNNEVSYMIVGGGGGGGNYTGGGGGAGGFRESKSSVDTYTASPIEGATPVTVTATSFPITVGGGGAGSPMPNDPGGPGCSGSSSTALGITSAGGGNGGGGNSFPVLTGGPGGSGGGGSEGSSGGSGNTPPVSPAQGFNGGTGSGPGPQPDYSEEAGAGGGATQLGGNGNHNGPPTANGGAGATTSISGTPTAYAGGGGGGRGQALCGSCQPQGGTGGGGNGSFQTADSTTGTANTGGGGGGTGAAFTPCSQFSGKAGGSGIVIIRYKYQ